jgi:hypothetical protein
LLSVIGKLSIEDACYYHNGQVDTTTKIVEEFFGDFKKYGLPFLDKQFERLKSNEIVNCGFAYIENLQIDKEKLKIEITNELKKGGFLLSSIKHPIYAELKEKLLSVKGQSREDRQLIRNIAYELLELWWTK